MDTTVLPFGHWGSGGQGLFHVEGLEGPRDTGQRVRRGRLSSWGPVGHRVFGDFLGSWSRSGRLVLSRCFGVWVFLIRASVPFSFKGRTCLPSALLPPTACVCPAAGTSTWTPGTRKRSACCTKCVTQVSRPRRCEVWISGLLGYSHAESPGGRGGRLDHRSRKAALRTPEAPCHNPSGELVVLECSCCSLVMVHTLEPTKYSSSVALRAVLFNPCENPVR